MVVARSFVVVEVVVGSFVAVVCFIVVDNGSSVVVKVAEVFEIVDD